MLVFIEYTGVEPTNNASEGNLRFHVILCKVIGRTRGGVAAMRRLDDFISCAWWNRGKNVMQEVAGRVREANSYRHLGGTHNSDATICIA